MAHARNLLAACWLLALAGHALADQNDPRLDDLFEALKSAPTAIEAAPIEQEIWSIWVEFPQADAAALMQGGTVAMANRDFAAALAQFDRLIEIAPDFAEAWNKRATAHYLAGNYEESLRDATRTIELEPRHFGALSGLGMVHVQLDDLSAALASFEAALAVHPYLRGATANAGALRKMLDQRDI